MTTRVVKDSNSNRIAVVESDSRSEAHDRVHYDTDLGRLMDKHRVPELTGSSAGAIKSDMEEYDRERERMNDTRYSRSDRDASQSKVEGTAKKYGFW